MAEQNIVIGGKDKDGTPQIVDNEFKVPTDIVELPSKGAFYPGGKASITIKYLTAEEDNILYSPELIKNNQVLNVLLDSAVMDKDLRPENMLSGDRNYILIQLRKTGFGSEYDPGLKVECENCESTYNPVVDLDRLKANMLEVLPDEKGEYSVQLPVTKANIKFRPLRGFDEKRLSKVIDQGQKKGTNLRVSKLITERYLLQIMEVNGNRDKIYIQKFIGFMPTKDSIFFRLYSRNVEPGIDLDYEFECPHCGYKEIHSVPITSKLFYPDLEEKKPEASAE